MRILRHVVIAGASLAGTRTAEALRDDGYAGDITLVGAEPELPYTRPPLSKNALADGISHADLALHDRSWFEDQEIKLVLGTAAAGLDPRAREIVLDDGRTITYDAVVIATGSSARRFPGLERHPRVHQLRDLADAVELRCALTAGGRLLVLGAGYIGLEAAATARGLGVEVVVAESLGSPLGRVFGSEVGRWYGELHRAAGVDLRTGVSVDRVEVGESDVRARLATGEILTADHILVAVGSVPNVGWLASSGLDLSDGVRCHHDLSTEAPAVYAVGDVARWRNPTFDEVMRIEHWTNATDQARHVSGSILGASDPFESVPYFWSDQYDARLRFVGRANGADVISVEEPDGRSLVVRYGRRDRVIGAVCVNAPRRLPELRAAIAAREPWSTPTVASAVVTR